MFSSDIRFGKHLTKQIMPLAKVMSTTARYQNLVVSNINYYRHSEAKHPPTLPVELVKPCHLLASLLGQSCGKI